MESYTHGKILPIDIEREMKKSYIDYAMSVIVSRALPDVRDGRKPVHRRILDAMHEASNTPDKPYKKSARTVGDVLGRYHPHGDSAVYDALVRLAQDFSIRYPLIDGHGNFGCFTGDTRIKLVDGTTKSFKELAALGPDARFYVYSVDVEGHIVVGEGRNARITRRDAELVEVTLDNGERIRCTPDHRFMLRDGTYKHAQDLTPDDSLMPGYFDLARVREGSSEYLRIKQPDGTWSFVHRLADHFNKEHGLLVKTDLNREARTYNHRIVSVRWLAERADVCDITVDEHHNFLLDAGVFVHNSVDGDPPAAMRYTEARLSKLAMQMLADIDKKTVDFQPNFDGADEEPKVLPSKFPNLLVNGSAGIAVGMATNIPPHNLREVIDGVILMIDNPQVTTKELMMVIKGPDFPTGALIMGREGIKSAYTTGRGSIIMRAVAQIETMSGGKSRILVTEIPYQVNKAKLIERIADLVREKKIDGITDLRDESDRTGMRIVVELRRDANANVVLNQLYKFTPMQETFGVIMLALVDNAPRVLDLRDMVFYYLQHQKEVITRRTKFELEKAEARAHILEGLRIALDHIDAVIATIRASRTIPEARSNLMARFRLSEKQAQAIVEMQLGRLAGLEREKIEEEYAELVKTIEYLRAVLANERMVYQIIKRELTEIKQKFGDDRRTRITAAADEMTVEDLIAEEDAVITLTHFGYIKRLPVDTYRSQRRGGRGVTGMGTKEEDFVEHLFITTTHHNLLFVTNKGKAYKLKVHELPEASRQAKGTAIVNLLQVGPGEKITAVIPVKDMDTESSLFFATKFGIVKKTELGEFGNIRANGLIALGLDEGDELIGVKLTSGQSDIILVTAEGQAIRFSEEEVRPMGRAARGVIGIKLDRDDVVVGMEVADDTADLLVVTDLGFGKRTPLAEYRVTGRGGKGIRTIKLTRKNGTLVGVKLVKEGNELMIISANGVLIRLPVADVSRLGRDTQGVTLMRMDEGDKVVAVAQVMAKDEE